MPPTFTNTLSIPALGKPILAKLNRIQQDAVVKALRANEYLLLKGLPGTGKTETLIAIVRLLHLLGKRIIVTSHTHSAVDNVLLRLVVFGIPIMRIGDPSRVAEPLRPLCECNLLRDCQSPEDMDRVYNAYVSIEYPLIFSTPIFTPYFLPCICPSPVSLSLSPHLHPFLPIFLSFLPLPTSTLSLHFSTSYLYSPFPLHHPVAPVNNGPTWSTFRAWNPRLA